MNEARRKGLEIFAEVYGEDMAREMEAAMDGPKGFGMEQMRWTLEWAFGEVWARDGLERKMRSCAVLGMLIARGNLEEIKFHTRMGLANGLTKTEIEEIFYTAIPYAGFPAAASAKSAILEGFAIADKAAQGASGA